MKDWDGKGKTEKTAAGHLFCTGLVIAISWPATEGRSSTAAVIFLLDTYFASSIMISLLLAMNFVISSGASGL